MAVFTPLSIFLAPSFVQSISDLVLAVGFPLHGYWGMRLVVMDYFPESSQVLLILLLILTILSSLGLLRLCIEGEGISGTIKRLFHKKKDEDEDNE